MIQMYQCQFLVFLLYYSYVRWYYSNCGPHLSSHLGHLKYRLWAPLTESDSLDIRQTNVHCSKVEKHQIKAFGKDKQNKVSL